MSRITASLSALLIAFTLIATTPAVQARAPRKYQVTGKVLEVTDEYIAVDKAGDRWEIGRDTNTKVTGALKVGATVTIEYTMSARSVDVKEKK